ERVGILSDVCSNIENQISARHEPFIEVQHAFSRREFLAVKYQLVSVPDSWEHARAKQQLARILLCGFFHSFTLDQAFSPLKLLWGPPPRLLLLAPGIRGIPSTAFFLSQPMQF